MRICVVTVAVHGLGGMQRHTHELVAGLVAAGHEVEVVAPGAAGELNDLHGARWHFVDARKPDSRWHEWLSLSREEFERAHAVRPFDVVHSESTSALGLVRGGVHRVVPLTLKFHGNYLGLAKAHIRRGRRGSALREGKALLWLTRVHFRRGNCWSFRSCDWMVPSHQQFAETRISHVMREDRGHVVPNGVDTERFRPLDRATTRARLGLGPEPTLVCVGRLNYEKGIHHAIAAVRALEEARLLVIGEGEHRGELEALVDRLGVRERVSFLGPQTPEAVAAYLAASDVFLFPTEREEAAPLVLPEAMACGLPVVATRIGGITEVIGRPGTEGILVPPGDVAAVVAGVDGLLRDAGRRHAMGRAARDRVIAEYTLERMVERTLAVYETAISRLRGRVAAPLAA